MSAPSIRPSPVANATLILSAAALVGLAAYQWTELVAMRAGATPACAINDTLNCATVWNSPFASLVHEGLGFPVAGLGVLWGTVALGLSAIVGVLSRRNRDAALFVSAIKFWALAGLLSCVVFAIASMQSGAACLTCLGTYSLTFIFAATSFAKLPGNALPERSHLPLSVAWCAVLGAPIFLGLLYPGSRTPKAAVALDTNASTATGQEAVVQIIESLSAAEKQAVASARKAWLSSPMARTDDLPTRLRKGPADAPVKIVELSDILCGHCQQFEKIFEQIEKMAPEGRLSFEPRYFPLDSECNPSMAHTTGDGVRCLGAKIQICLEDHPRYFDIRHELFENQASLTRALAMQIAEKSGIKSDALQTCVDSPETAKKLADDIEFGKRYRLEGTPLIVLNGRVAPLSPVFLLGMVMASGDVDADFFKALPSTATQPSRQ